MQYSKKSYIFGQIDVADTNTLWQCDHQACLVCSVFTDVFDHSIQLDICLTKPNCSAKTMFYLTKCFNRIKQATFQT